MDGSGRRGRCRHGSDGELVCELATAGGGGVGGETLPAVRPPLCFPPLRGSPLRRPAPPARGSEARVFQGMSGVGEAGCGGSRRGARGDERLCAARALDEPISGAVAHPGETSTGESGKQMPKLELPLSSAGEAHERRPSGRELAATSSRLAVFTTPSSEGGGLGVGVGERGAGRQTMGRETEAELGVTKPPRGSGPTLSSSSPCLRATASQARDCLVLRLSAADLLCHHDDALSYPPTTSDAALSKHASSSSSDGYPFSAALQPLEDDQAGRVGHLAH